jgi:predicted RNase H-like nuclease (RuvC/YqgF family)
VVAMKISACLIVPLILLVVTLPAAAEFYRYTDAHGNVLFTDDLSKVPADQRAKVEPYEDTPARTELPSVKTDAETNTKTPAADDDIEKERARLQAQEKTLNQEYENLMSTRARLNEEKTKAVTNTQIQTYNQKIAEFNEQIQAYEKQRDAMAEAVKAFEKKIKDNAQEAHQN